LPLIYEILGVRNCPASEGMQMRVVIDPDPERGGLRPLRVSA
jgi:hypothetical protein